MNGDGIEFDDSLTAAEVACYALLCERLGLSPGENAFVSIRGENAADCIVFDIGHLQSGESMAFEADQLHFRASAEIYGRSRATVQKTIMRMVRSFPIGGQFAPGHHIREDSNVLEFRVAAEQKSIGPVTTQEVQLKTGGPKVPLFAATVLFDVVFATGARGEN